MDCKAVGELLIPYLDGELNKEEKEIVELHLSACPHCQEELESLSTTQNQLRKSFAILESKTPSPQAWTGLQQRLVVEGQPGVTIFNRVKSQPRKAVNILSRGLGSRQPVWKPLAGALAVVLVVGLVLAIPPFLGESQEILAADIVQNDPQVHDLLPEGTVVEVTKVVRPREGNIFNVLFEIPDKSVWGDGDGSVVITIDALVDVSGRKVLELKVVSTGEIPIMLLSIDESKKAIEIANADPIVQDILDGGAEINRVIHLPFFHLPDSLLNGKVVGVVLMAPSSDSQSKSIPEWESQWKSQKWIVAVDLDNEKVVRITVTTA